MRMKKVEMSLVSFFCLSILFKAHGQEPIAMFILSLSWPNGFCLGNNGCRTPPPQYFTIHGFWPQRSDGNSIQNCTPESPQLSSNELYALNGVLSVPWPSLVLYKSDFTFWREEWAKHGTCSNMRPQPYFGAAVRLKNQINLLDALAHQGIRPGCTTTPQAIKWAIYTARGYGPQVVCFPTQKGMVVGEIRFCVSPTTPQEPNHRFISCPENRSPSCNGNGNIIGFPPEERARGSRNAKLSGEF